MSRLTETKGDGVISKERLPVLEMYGWSQKKATRKKSLG